VGKQHLDLPGVGGAEMSISLVLQVYSRSVTIRVKHPDSEAEMATPKRKQLNVRLDEESADRLDRLIPVVSKVVGLNLSQSDIIRLALLALEEKHAAKDTKKGGKK
jgi:hypothetical protein